MIEDFEAVKQWECNMEVKSVTNDEGIIPIIATAHSKHFHTHTRTLMLFTVPYTLAHTFKCI